MSNKELSQKLNAILKQSKHTQVSLAKYLKVPVTTVNSWFRGTRRIPTTKITAICDFLDITPDELFNNCTHKKSNAEIELLQYFRALPEYQQGIIVGEAKTMYNSLVKPQIAARTYNNDANSTESDIDIHILKKAENKANLLD